ncbi:hypothetical protein [Bacteroides sp. UBA939]|uniref:hypothetical protein n=1 Tax=Bacteroides sp. UBA939 TaxID=1946092 RepID=UPI0025B8AF3C|nr:hypothetical protein [Bacteroides sp. UBA939]
MKAKIFILLLSFSLFSCDPYIFRVAIDGNSFEKSFNFECGKIDISGHVLANSQTSIFLKFNLSSPIMINPENMKAVHKGELLAAEVFLSNVGLMDKAKAINNNDEVRIIIDRVIKSGDTITVNIDDFILCADIPFNIGDVNFIFVHRN